MFHFNDLIYFSMSLDKNEFSSRSTISLFIERLFAAAARLSLRRSFSLNRNRKLITTMSLGLRDTVKADLHGVEHVFLGYHRRGAVQD